MITSPHRFYTRTLASLYLAQGYLDQAEEAYGYLAGRYPENCEFRDALELIAQKKMEKDKGGRSLVDLVRVWKDLLREEKRRSRER